MDALVLIFAFTIFLTLGIIAMRVDVYLDQTHGLTPGEVLKNFRLGMLAVIIGAGVWTLILHLLIEVQP